MSPDQWGLAPLMSNTITSFQNLTRLELSPTWTASCFSCFFELVPDVFIPPGPSGDLQLWVFYLKLGQSSLEFLKQNFIKYTCLKSSEKCWHARICLLSFNLLFLALHFRYMNVELMFSSLWPASCWRNQPIRSSLCWTLWRVLWMPLTSSIHQWGEN